MTERCRVCRSPYHDHWHGCDCEDCLHPERICRRCGGGGYVDHPRWGARNCPVDLIDCPDCGGERLG